MAGKEKKRILHSRLIAVSLLLSQLEEEYSDISDEEKREQEAESKDTPRLDRDRSPPTIKPWTKERRMTDSPLLPRASRKQECRGSGGHPSGSQQPQSSRGTEENDVVWKLQEYVPFSPTRGAIRTIFII